MSYHMIEADSLSRREMGYLSSVFRNCASYRKKICEGKILKGKNTLIWYEMILECKHKNISSPEMSILDIQQPP